MKLNKKKITRLTNNQANSIVGGQGQGTNGSTNKNFTCCWCSQGGEDTRTCESDNQAEPICNSGPGPQTFE